MVIAMFAFKIIEQEVKPFMNKLLREEAFDKFEVRGAEIWAVTKFSINGALNKEYIEVGGEPLTRSFCLWQEIKPYILFIIKNNKRPKFFKLTLSYPQGHVESVHENAQALFINITFENNEILCTTATSEKNFSLEKIVDVVWENRIRNFLKKNGIAVIEL